MTEIRIVFTPSYNRRNRVCISSSKIYMNAIYNNSLCSVVTQCNIEPVRHYFLGQPEQYSGIPLYSSASRRLYRRYILEWSEECLCIARIKPSKYAKRAHFICASLNENFRKKTLCLENNAESRMLKYLFCFQSYVYC